MLAFNDMTEAAQKIYEPIGTVSSKSFLCFIAHTQSIFLIYWSISPGRERVKARRFIAVLEWGRSVSNSKETAGASSLADHITKAI
jgi:hypothetical protein